MPGIESPEAELARQYDQEVTKLYDDYADQAYRCARRGLPHEDAEEIVNFAFLAARVNWDRVRSSSVPVGYVVRTALNLRADAISRTVAQRGVSLDELNDSQIIGAALGPGARHDLYTDLRLLLSELSPREEQVVVLYYWIGLPVREIAETLGLQPGDVSRTLFDARTRLRRLMSDPSDPDDSVDPAGGGAS